MPSKFVSGVLVQVVLCASCEQPGPGLQGSQTFCAMISRMKIRLGYPGQLRQIGAASEDKNRPREIFTSCIKDRISGGRRLRRTSLHRRKAASDIQGGLGLWTGRRELHLYCDG